MRQNFYVICRFLVGVGMRVGVGLADESVFSFVYILFTLTVPLFYWQSFDDHVSL